MCVASQQSPSNKWINALRVCTIKEAECLKTDAFKLWNWRKLFESLGLQGDQASQSWIFIGRTVAEVEAKILQSPDMKNWFTGKDPDAGEDWRQAEKGMRGDEMVGWYHRLNGLEFEQTLRDSGGQRSWCAAVHRVLKSGTGLSDWTITTSMNSDSLSILVISGYIPHLHNPLLFFLYQRK